MSRAKRPFLAPAAPALFSRRLLFLAFCLLAPFSARAHDPFIAEIKGLADDSTLTFRITFARSVAAHLAGLNQGPRNHYPRESFTADKPSFDRAATALCVLELDGRPLTPLRAVAETVADEDIDVIFSLSYARPSSGSGRLRLANPWLARLPAAERYTATFVLHEDSALLAGPALLTGEEPVVEFLLAPAGRAGVALGTGEPAANAPRSGWLGFFRLGVEHILAGYDHLLYLAALILGCVRFRLIVGIVTAFTLSHSLTLALATLGVFSPPSALVEQAIAVTIVFVAVENIWLRGREPRLRHVVAFAFGLVHGFGFAGILADLGLGVENRSVLVPLLAFNLGVEAGQLLLIACALPLLLRARRHPAFVAYGQPAASLCVAGMGLYWFVDRL